MILATSPNSPAGQSTMSSIGEEMKSNPPAVLNSTRRKFGVDRARKQRTAILLSKARSAGVKIPSSSPQSFSK
jgi:hypothetical protein